VDIPGERTPRDRTCLRQQVFRRTPVSAMVTGTGGDGGELARRIGPLQSDLPRGLRAPGHPVVPVLSVAFCLYLDSGLSGASFALFAGWLALAAVVYVTCFGSHSELRTPVR
jgi:hypothetical protein